MLPSVILASAGLLIVGAAGAAARGSANKDEPLAADVASAEARHQARVTRAVHLTKREGREAFLAGACLVEDEGFIRWRGLPDGRVIRELRHRYPEEGDRWIPTTMRGEREVLSLRDLGQKISRGPQGRIEGYRWHRPQGSKTTNSLVLWHGSQRWEGPPEVRPSIRGSAEHGPGVYLTTAFTTAARYAKGGGRVIRFDLDPEITWLEDVRLPLDSVVAWVQAQPRLTKRAEILADLRQASARRPDGTVWAPTIVNLLVNHRALSGAHGPALSAWLVEQGIDASHANNRGDEDWVVLFNLRKVRRWTPVSPADVSAEQMNQPRIVRGGRALSGPYARAGAMVKFG